MRPNVEFAGESMEGAIGHEAGFENVRKSG
jgi:hypothetical protein